MQTVVKTTRVFSEELLSAARRQGDAPADAVIDAVLDEGGKPALAHLMRWLSNTTDFSTEKQHPAVQAFFKEQAKLPDWADSRQMEGGMAFFQKHAGLIGLVLGAYSLPYTYMGANGVQVLWLTERIKNDTARRLEETGAWVFAVNNPKEWQSGRAISYTLKIRLIHAATRSFVLSSGRWNMDWGLPVNQEDMVGTIGAFSYIVLRGLRKLGVRATAEEEEAYLHHSNVVGYLNGVRTELMPRNLREAFHIDRKIAKRQFTPSEAGIGLTKALLDAIADQIISQSTPPNTSRRESVRNLAAAQMRFFLGDSYANALDIPAVPFQKQVIEVVSQLPLFSKLAPNYPR